MKKSTINLLILIGSILAAFAIIVAIIAITKQDRGTTCLFLVIASCCICVAVILHLFTDDILIFYYEKQKSRYNTIIQEYDELTISQYDLKPKEYYEQQYKACKEKIDFHTAKIKALQERNEHKSNQQEINKL